MDPIDLGPAARRLGRLIAGVTDERLDAATPCPAYTLRELIGHVSGLPLAFGAAGRKERNELTEATPDGDPPALAPDFRTAIPATLAELAELWRHPETWDGMTRVAGMDMPAESVGLTLADELLVHGWDVARAVGEPYDADPATLAAARRFLAMFVSDDLPEGDRVAFGRPKPVPDGASELERVVALAGRDVGWVTSGT